MSPLLEFMLLTAAEILLFALWAFALAMGVCPPGSRGRRIWPWALLVSTAALVVALGFTVGWAFVWIVGLLTVGLATLIAFGAERRRSAR